MRMLDAGAASALSSSRNRFFSVTKSILSSRGRTMRIHIELEPDEERALLERARLCGRHPVQHAPQIIRDHVGRPPHETAQEGATQAKPSVEDLIDHEFIAACARQNSGDVPTLKR